MDNNYTKYAAITLLLAGHDLPTVWESAWHRETELDLSECDITDAVLACFIFPRAIILLDLSNNLIRDVAPLAQLINLTWLKLSNNQISDIAPLAQLINLSSLSLWDNEISDIAPLKHLKARIYR